MKPIGHHVPEAILTAYAAGTLGYPYELVVASHVSMCDECRARLTAIETAGGAVMEQIGTSAVSGDLRDRVFAGLDAAPPPREIHYPRSGPLPGPVMETLSGREPRWRSLGMGVKQCILHEGDEGSARLLFIPPEQAVPEHGHNGLEMTLVLQGSYHDDAGTFGVGDVEIADGDVDHIPTAGKGAPCICLAATDAPLRFRSWQPRLVQRLFRI